MRTLTPEELTDYAERYGLTAPLAQRDYVAVRVAHAIASDDTVMNSLAMKGGFVLRFGYGSPRTSKDLDGTIGTRHSNVDPVRVQRLVRNQCQDISLRMGAFTTGVDSLDFGDISYSGPLGNGHLSLEMSFREDLVLPARALTIDAFGVAPFKVRAIALNEMIAEKWRCLVERRTKPGDPYDLWYLWSEVRTRKPMTADDLVDPAEVRRLVPRKTSFAGGLAGVGAALENYRRGWPAAIGDPLPTNAPKFSEVEAAVLEAARAWTPWK